VSAALPDGDRVFLDTVLQPHRSLPARGFYILMAALAALSLVVGTICILVGAWPIFGFFGLDIVLVYVALKLSYRAARARECVRLTGESLTVEHISVRGARKFFRFEPFWARVRLRDAAGVKSLSVGSHGREVVLGSFLAPEAKESFARQLLDALKRWRACVERGDAH